MATIYINDEAIEIADDERLNGIEAARRVGVEIPHYCWHPALSVVASCRMCLVETGTKDAESGEVRMMPKLVPACQTPARDGTVFLTDTDKIRAARAMVEEDLLINHPIDCPVCDKAGECHLQDYHFEHGKKERRADIRPFHSRRREMGETVNLFVDRCIMCTRCVRFCREITETSELMVSGRGSTEEIDIFPGFPLENKLAGNVVDLCPVGALGDTNFLYSQRVWFMKSHDGVCTGCSTGCSIHIDVNQDKVYRLRPRENQAVNQWWMCDEGRYGWTHVHDPSRFISPRLFDSASEKSQLADWTHLPQTIDAAFKTAAETGRLAAVLSPHLTVEEAYLLCEYVRSLDAEAIIAVGSAPTVREDETFPNGFTIRAEKCPNRRGIEEVAAHWMQKAFSWDDLLKAIGPQTTDAGQVAAAWVTAAYKKDWIDEETAAKFDAIETLLVQDLFDSPLLQRAKFQLPAASFAERDGSYVNHYDYLQSVPWAVRPPAGVKTEGQLLWQLTGREGMYNAKALLQEIASEIAYFSAANKGVPATGIDLKETLLADSTNSPTKPVATV